MKSSFRLPRAPHPSPRYCTMSPVNVNGARRNSPRHLYLLVSSDDLALSIGKWTAVKQYPT
jgi:hypothetical protein